MTDVTFINDILTYKRSASKGWRLPMRVAADSHAASAEREAEREISLEIERAVDSGIGHTAPFDLALDRAFFGQFAWRTRTFRRARACRAFLSKRGTPCH